MKWSELFVPSFHKRPFFYSFLFTFSLILVTVCVSLTKQWLSSTDSFITAYSYKVVLDAGHGGADPGKVSASGVLEKDINLNITLKCKKVLEQNGIYVILTRSTDQSLEDTGTSNAKASDLQNRKSMMENNDIDCAVSIHQNSYPDASQHGAQVFYNPSSEDSKLLAQTIQNQLLYLTSQENTRKIKANTDYYLLRENSVPTVIAEICFLSNPDEAIMIQEETMQEKAAFCLAMGIMQYLHTH